MKEIKRLISVFFLLFGLTITLLRADTTTPTVVSIGLDQTSSKGYHLLKGNELIFAVEFTETVSIKRGYGFWVK